MVTRRFLQFLFVVVRSEHALLDFIIASSHVEDAQVTEHLFHI